MQGKDAGKLTERERELYLRVIDGDFQRAGKICYVIANIKPNRIEDMLKWLVQHRLTGSLFADWFENMHQGSPLSMMTFITRHLENEKESRPLYAGRDISD